MTKAKQLVFTRFDDKVIKHILAQTSKRRGGWSLFGRKKEVPKATDIEFFDSYTDDMDLVKDLKDAVEQLRGKKKTTRNENVVETTPSQTGRSKAFA